MIGFGRRWGGGWLPSALAVLVALTGSIGLAVATDESYLPVSAKAGACRPTWVTGWQAAAQPGPSRPGLGGATVRMVVHPQVTGSKVRLRLSNVYGATPLAVGAVTAARSDGAAGLILGTARPVPFGGRQAVVIPPGAEVVSDAVPLVAEAGSPLAVSVFLPVVPQVLTQHPVMQAAYLSGPGDVTFGDAGAFGAQMPSSVVLTGIDVYAPRPQNSVVAVGDSITDGMGAAPGESWPDVLGTQLVDAGGATTMAVLGAGISGNRLLADTGPQQGDVPLARFDRDVAAAGGATDVVLSIGTNDIAAGRSAADIAAGLQRFAERARAAGKRVFLTTVTPSAAGAHGTPAAVAARRELNAWVREHGPAYADGVFDFAAAVADPADPDRLAQPFDAGDGLHLSAAGYRALAAAVDPALFTGSPCLAGNPPARVLVSNR
ncbi:lysophospholipase L1-like esterase [Pseudonocardia hierapolitana]|uniref:Lysophospholipase L1-like esterase n=1 Tax=Pseudonocardia hierapolitana TaxID=1128676 RepID=A0A561SPP0_9PSEU|nr:GDSL-type esterase/lipase family protein [Pseudonocardia hierapolitana]TWF76811.1 lysophospholipase L1-like esterase [Pseudonocardia hierapolitana]